jgi:TolB-like protein/Tfp pilus assembly protein PilF
MSYARVDCHRVAALAKALSDYGYEVWWDALMEGGAAYAERIEAQLASADAVLAVWSKESVKSDWVRDEAGQGRDSHKLVAVTLDGTHPPIGFGQYHVVDLSSWKGAIASEEFRAISSGIAAVSRHDRGVPPKPMQNRSFSRRTAVLGAGAIVVTAGAGMLVTLRPWAPAPVRNSVAVLPFQNLSGDPTQSYFSDGLSEEIRAALTRNAALKVAAPTSSNMFRDNSQDAKHIGARLNVAYLLEGSVRRVGNVVRIAAELIEAQSGFTRWSQDFEREFTDIFAIQSEIAATVANAMAIRATQPIDLPGGTTNGAAYDAYLRGRALFNADEGEATDRAALAQFESAILLDPSYAAAYAARSRSLAGIAAQYASADQLKSLYAEAIATAQRAVALAPELATGYLALAFATFTGRLDFRGARAPFERAAALGARDADVLLLYAMYASKAGLEQGAGDAVSRAIDLDPLNPRAWRAAASVAYAAGHYDEVIASAQHALSLSPTISNAHAMIGNAFFETERFQEAQAAYGAEPNRSFSLAGLAIVLHRLGNQSSAEQARAQLIASFGDSAMYQQAQIAAQWGDASTALADLEKARAVGDSGLLYMPTDPMLRNLRGDPRYGHLVRGMGLA